MRMTSTRWAALVVAAALAGPVAGCVAAAAAGAAGAIYATTRGAEALVYGSVDEVTARAQTVMADMEIAPSARRPTPRATSTSSRASRATSTSPSRWSARTR